MATRQIRPIRVEGNIAYVPLTRGYEAVIDAADVPLVDGYNWRAQVDKKSSGAVRAVYAVRSAGRASVYMHRAITGDPGEYEVDHRDCNGLNNRRHNLRRADALQNRHNQRIRGDNSSGHKGVTWNRCAAKWQAKIVLNGKTKHAGYFGCKTAAANAYAKASAELHGAFGRVS